jgi:hypothetical protein
MEVSWQMPHVIRPPRLKARLGALVSALAVASIALPAAAQAACPTTPVSQPFQRFGDNANYSPLSNGGFESGATGWSLSGASVISGNETYHVRAPSDVKSLSIPATGTVASPAFCVGIEHPSFRFFARRTSGTWGVLNVKLRWTEQDGRTNEVVVGSLSGDPYTSWQPTPMLPLAVTLPLWQAGSSLNVRVVFDPEDFGGSWAIDDVYIDPYAR